ncbi:MAG: hypothetical protein ACPLWB_00915 [Caldisericia bacterium]
MYKEKTCIIVIGEGGIPTDFPKNELIKFLNLKSKIECGINLQEEENIIFEELSSKIKKWKRNFRNDEYYHSLVDLQNLIFIKSKIKTEIAFLDYCEPDLFKVLINLIENGYEKIILISPTLILSKQNEFKINDILNFIELKYKDLKIINLCNLDFEIVSKFFIDLIEGEINDK